MTVLPPCVPGLTIVAIGVGALELANLIVPCRLAADMPTALML